MIAGMNRSTSAPAGAIDAAIIGSTPVIWPAGRLDGGDEIPESAPAGRQVSIEGAQVAPSHFLISCAPTGRDKATIAAMIFSAERTKAAASKNRWLIVDSKILARRR